MTTDSFEFEPGAGTRGDFGVCTFVGLDEKVDGFADATVGVGVEGSINAFACCSLRYEGITTAIFELDRGGEDCVVGAALYFDFLVGVCTVIVEFMSWVRSLAACVLAVTGFDVDRGICFPSTVLLFHELGVFGVG